MPAEVMKSKLEVWVIHVPTRDDRESLLFVGLKPSVKDVLPITA